LPEDATPDNRRRLNARTVALNALAAGGTAREPTGTGGDTPHALATHDAGRYAAALVLVPKGPSGYGAICTLYEGRSGSWDEVISFERPWMPEPFTAPPYETGEPLIEVPGLSSYSVDGAQVVVLAGQAVEGVDSVRAELGASSYEARVDVKTGSFVLVIPQGRAREEAKIYVRRGSAREALLLTEDGLRTES
jgi:hypothetical protein